MTTANEDQGREARLRRRAKRLGLHLQKSRARNLSVDNQGGYALIDPNRSVVVWGPRFEMDLGGAEKRLDEWDAGKR